MKTTLPKPKGRVMLDLETMGNRPGCAIVAIGAVAFTDAGEISSFYTRVDLQSCVGAGLHMDANTVLWWLSRDNDARAELTKSDASDKRRLPEALMAFAMWLLEFNGIAEMWGNGAAFDNAVLAAAYDAINFPRPWHFTADRCYRTVKAMYPNIPMQRTGVYHHALDDARSQTKHLLEMLSA